MERCSNCNSRLGSTMIGSEVKVLSKQSIEIINNFLPDELKSESFCERCGIYDERVRLELFNIYVKYKRYYNNLDEEIFKIRKERDEVLSSQVKERMKTYYDSDYLVKFYSYVPSNIMPIEFIESQIIIDTGMWSTSSDNLDALWSAMHDRIARDGIDSNNKISDGFRKIKGLLKRECFIKGGNTIVDVKYNFSELAGNGKVLFHIQGTAGIDKELETPKFNSIENEMSIRIAELNQKINKIYKFKTIKPIEDFKDLLKTTKT